MTKQINLALQGGGSHGAFTWGVLDALLEDERIGIEAISGTSAGAMNAVVVADGLMRGGPEQARARLDQFWRTISDAANSSPIQRSPLAMLMGNWSLDTSPGYLAFEAMSRTFSPYQANPLNLNPLRDVLISVVDFEQVRHCDAVKLFISATDVHTGRVKIFNGHELTADMVMASACLPQLFQAVEIDGVPYWDGGYMGNPALFPFFKGCDSADIMIVQINPVERRETPDTPQEIQNRINEITFNASMLKELRAIDFITRLIEKGQLAATDYRKMHLHIVRNEEVLNPLGATSKLNAEWAFLQMLRDAGRESALQWLEENFSSLGEHSSIDLRAMFQGRAGGAALY